MFENELKQLAIDLCDETPQPNAGQGIELVIAPCGLANSLSYMDFEVVKAHVHLLRPEIRMRYDIGITLP